MIIINCFNKKFGRICSIIAKLIIYFKKVNKKVKFFLLNYNNFKNIMYYKHSGYIGNLKKKIYINKKYQIRKSIYKMLPKTCNRINLIKNVLFE